MPKRVLFYDTTRRLLNVRLDQLRQGTTPKWSDIRHFFYECRNKFLRENPSLLEPDTDSTNPYSDWQGTMNNWCAEHCEEFGILPDLYWRLRELLNIWPESRAICVGEEGGFLINSENRVKVSEGVSFILVCEKKTVTRELLDTLQGEGYKLKIVATGGHSVSDVQEVVLQIRESIDSDIENFYCVILHDYDLDGVKIYYKLKDRYKGVLDVGVNGDFIQYLKKRGNFNPRLVEEQKLNKNYQGELRERMLQSDDYSLEDFDYLQGQPFQTTYRGQPKNHWRGKRIEIDAIHVEYGIQPFVDYILEKIQTECKVWDLSRIGVSEFELEEPPDHYQDTIDVLRSKAASEYKKRLRIIQQPRINVIDIVRQATREGENEFWQVAKKHWGHTYKSLYGGWEFQLLKSKKLDQLREDYKDQIGGSWAGFFEDELDEINSQLTHYKGDVRTGEENLQRKIDLLQERLNEEKVNDPKLTEFEYELEEVDWGKDEIEEIATPDETALIKMAIEALQSRLTELIEVNE